MPERVVLVDGSALVFRAYFALPMLSTSQGLHTNATYGFARAFAKLLAARRPELGAVVMDAPGKTFRAERFPAYKAFRRRVPPELAEQWPWIERLVAAHGFPLVRVPGFEADDVVATLCRQALAAGHEVLLVSGDKDLAQLVGPQVKLLDVMRERTFDEALVRKRFGVGPQQLVDWLALVGDSVDNLPGVKGIGAKGACQLLERHGTLDALLAATGELKGRQRSALEAGREQALLTRDLARLRQDVPLPLELAALRLPPADPGALDAIYRELEFYSLLSQEGAAESLAGSGEEDFAALEDPAAAGAWLSAALEAGQPLAVVACLDEPGPGCHAPLVGLALADRPGRARWLPIPPQAALRDDPAWGLLRAWLEDPACEKVSHEWKQLYVALGRRGVTPRGCRFDCGLASFLLDATKLVPHRLDQVAREYLQRPLRAAASVTGEGAAARPLSSLPAGDVAPWACQQAAAVAALHPLLRERLEAEGQREQLLTRDLPLSDVLGDMELVGIAVDREDLARLGQELRARAAELEAEAHRVAGREFNLGSPKQLSQLLFEELELPVIKRTKTGYSTDEEVLLRLAPRHPLPRLVLEQRKLTKLVNTYTDVLQREVDPASGRIHATFQQTVGASGRLVTTRPDLQRTPMHTPEGKRIRRAFVSAPGWRLISADWHQLDLRLLAHLSRDEELVSAFRQGVDVHTRTAARLFEVEPAAVTPEQRRVGKTVNYGTVYGQGATALGQTLGVPRPEAQAWIARFFQHHPAVREWIDQAIADARARGHATTLLGRKRTIPELRSQDPMIQGAGERSAVVTALQGSAADICKQVMLEVAARFRAEGLAARLLLQVHDELVLEAPREEVERAAALLRERMEQAVTLCVPLAISLGSGDSWAEAHP